MGSSGGLIPSVVQATWAMAGPAGGAVCAAVLGGLSWAGSLGLSARLPAGEVEQREPGTVSVIVIRSGKLERQSPIRPMASGHVATSRFGPLAMSDAREASPNALTGKGTEIYASPARVIAHLEDSLVD